MYAQPSLAACAAKGECIVFDSQYNLQGHGTTDTAYWMETQVSGEREGHGVYVCMDIYMCT